MEELQDPDKLDDDMLSSREGQCRHTERSRDGNLTAVPITSIKQATGRRNLAGREQSLRDQPRAGMVIQLSVRNMPASDRDRELRRPVTVGRS